MYDHKTIEKKWQKKWEESKIYKTGEDKNKPKYYVLDMFPYPSGDGLHVGHPKGYVATDVVARFKMMNGFNVLHPMGWDAFGLPAENYALKTKTHPKIATQKNIQRFKEQLKVLGLTYDWEREINTTDPKYYKWTQWIFLQLLKHGLAYESYKPINWCPSCQTGLANEDLEDGKCERCGSEVEQKPMRQWVLKITDYAEKMLDGLKDLDWENSIIQMQKNWIGKSEGATVNFQITISNFQNQGNKFITVFTTRPDTLFGATYCVLSPEHELLKELESSIENLEEVKNYQEQARKKTQLERTDLNKDKTGVELEGVKAINPVNNEELPIFIADYVLTGYGTGAIMAVPAHDERDFEFAVKYNIQIKQVVAPNLEEYNHTLKVLELLKTIKTETDKQNIKFWLLGGLACAFYAKNIYRKNPDLDIIAENNEEQEKVVKVLEKLNFKKIKEKKVSDKLITYIYENNDGLEVEIGPYLREFGLQDVDFEEDEKELNGIRSLVVSKRFMKSFKEFQIKTRNEQRDKIDMEYLDGKVFADNGYAVNSDFLNGLSTSEAKQKITAWLEENNCGKKTINYRLQDWVFSRQRYWGEPIPVVHCEKCGVVAVPENQLPVELPEVENYEPTGTGESPLANIEEWVNTTCPACGGPAKRETNTMPQWAGSCWYYLRYIDPANNDAMVDVEKEKYWQPVDLYVGGAEHATRHLIYARFWHRFLYDIGAVSTPEPFTKLQHVGLIMGEDSRKMSKRWGNVVNPDDVVEQYGADSLRVYEMFMGPFDNAIAWSTQSLIGARRFLDKIEKISEKVSSQELKNKNTKLTSLLHKTIKKVGEDIQNLKFNTAISAMMILVNEMEKEQELPADEYQKLIMLISPFAPHLAEELWEKLGNTESIFKNGWPKYDENLIKDEEVELIIQINGKMRDKILVNANISDEDAKQQALSSEKIKKYLENQEVKKIIVVKGKLISIVI